nr:NAD(P)-dependent oxidoreductase [Pseudaminobacter sp.]
ALKDLGFALGMGKDFGVPLDLASRVRTIFEQGKIAYGGDAWSTQIVKLLEDAVGADLRAPGFPAKLEA